VTVRQPSPIDIIADTHTARLAELCPIDATFMGISGHDHQLNDYSPDGLDAVAQLNRSTLAELDDAAPADETDQVTLAAMRDRLGLDLELHEAGDQLADVNVLACPVQNLRDVLDMMPTDTADDWANIASRLRLMPQAITGYIASLRLGASKGLAPARRQVEEALKQASELADPASSFFVEYVAKAHLDGAPITESLAADLGTAARRATQAYGELTNFLADELAGVARTDDAVGRERYALHSREFVGAEVDLDETYAWGLDELDRISAEQQQVIEQIAGPGADMGSAVTILDQDPTQMIHGTEALQRWMQSTADTAISALDGVHFDIPEAVRNIECRIAPTATGGIYYTGPSDDFSRPGRMWWSVPPGVTEFATWREKTTVYHEGVPGHHLQISQAVLNRTQLNSWRRLASWSSGHGEGWALYAERLMEEFGFMNALGDRLGLLDGQRLRAARVVVDIGVHCRLAAPQRWGGGIWDADKAWTLLKANVNMDEASLRFELNRYLGWPGQAPSYKIGQRLWEQARAEAQTKAGASFDLKAWHTKALNLGSVPLAVLSQALN
jgi:uncharacterized protein (DUF885 family)